MYLKSSFFFVLVSATLIQLCQCDASSDAKIEMFKMSLNQRCQKNSKNATIVKELMAAVDDITSKSQSKFHATNNRYYDFDPEQLAAEPEKICEERKTISDTIEKVLPLLTECLSEDEKYLPGFLKESFMGFLNFSCENEGENLQKLISPQSKQCTDSLMRPNSKGALASATCLVEASKQNTDTTTDSFMKKDTLCEQLDDLEKCFGKVLHDHCPNDKSLPGLNTKFFDAISQPCTGCLLISNTMLFAFLASLVVKVFY